MKTNRTQTLAFLGTLCIAHGIGFAQIAASANLETNYQPNAALEYWQAFALMPSLSEENSQLLQTKHDVPLDLKRSKDLLAKYELSLSILEHAGHIPGCDWGIINDINVSLVIPSLPKMFEAARVLLLRARYRLETGDSLGGVQDIVTCLRLGSRGTPPIVINCLIQDNIDGLAVDLCSRNLSKMDHDSIEVLKKGFESLPPFLSIADALQTERIDCRIWIDEIDKDPKLEATRLKSVVAELISGGFSPTLEQLRAAFALEEPFYIEVQSALKLPYADRENRLKALKSTLGSNDKDIETDLELSLLACASTQIKGDVLRAKTAMLMAVLNAIVNGKPDLVKEIGTNSRDPFTSGPFTVQNTDGGIEIRSHLIAEDKPVTLLLVNYPSP